MFAVSQRGAFPESVWKSSPASHPAAPGKGKHSRGWWFDNIRKQGIAAFNNQTSTYKVYRNVKDYGATGLLSLISNLPCGLC